jgi:diacylglycerol kinase family enzyme
MVLRPLVLLISNLNQQGYNFTLTPNAKSNDGNLDMVYIRKINIFQILKLLIFVIQRKEISFNEVHRQSFSKMRITNLKGGSIEYEIDGEFFETNKKSLEIRVLNEKLSLIVSES